MTAKAYYVVENNVVTNIVLWDGNIQTWQPPVGAIMLERDTTPVMVWKFLEVIAEEEEIAGHTVITGEWKYVEEIGIGSIGFTWDGTKLITNESDPTTL